MSESNEAPILYPLFFFDGYLNWLKVSLENGDAEIRDWVASEEWDEWCNMWDGIDLDAPRLRRLLLSVWNPEVPEAHQGVRRYMRRD